MNDHILKYMLLREKKIRLSSYETRTIEAQEMRRMYRGVK